MNENQNLIKTIRTQSGEWGIEATAVADGSVSPEKTTFFVQTENGYQLDPAVLPANVGVDIGGTGTGGEGTGTGAGGEGTGGTGNGNLSADLRYANGKLYITVHGVHPIGEGCGTVDPSGVYYSVILNLVDCVSSNPADKAQIHSSYETEISPIDGHVITALHVTMGGVELQPVDGEIHIADVTGSIVIEAIAVEEGSADISGMVPWYREPAQRAIRYVQGLGDGYVHHLVISDMQYWAKSEDNRNYRHSLAVLRALQATGLFGKAIFLGDQTTTGSEDDLALLTEDGMQDFANDCLICCGANDNTTAAKEYYQALVGTEGVTYTNGMNNYYYDDAAHKVRYVVTSTSPGSGWATNPYIGAPAGWVCVSCSYRPIFPIMRNNVVVDGANDLRLDKGYTTSSTTTYFLEHVVQLLTRRVMAWLNGAFHEDGYGNYFGMPQFSYACDSNVASPDARIAGTETEQSFSVFSYNRSTGDVKSYRIGYRSDNFPQVISDNYTDTSTVRWLNNWYYFRQSGGSGYTYWVYSKDYNTKAALNIPIFVRQTETLYLYLTNHKPFAFSGKAYDANSTSIGFFSDFNGTNEQIWYKCTEDPRTYCVGAFIDRNVNAYVYDHIYLSIDFQSEDARRLYKDKLVITKTPPMFPDWTEISWESDNRFVLSTKKFTALTGAACSAKLVYVEPGKRVTVSVDDPDAQLGDVCIYFGNSPAINALHTVEYPLIPNSEEEGVMTNTYSAVCPEGYHYSFISGSTLGQYVEDLQVTITDA